MALRGSTCQQFSFSNINDTICMKYKIIKFYDMNLTCTCSGNGLCSNFKLWQHVFVLDVAAAVVVDVLIVIAVVVIVVVVIIVVVVVDVLIVIAVVVIAVVVIVVVVVVGSIID